MGRGRVGRGEAGRGGERQGTMAEDDEVCGREGREQKCGRRCGHEGTGAEVSVRRRTRTGQECRRRGGHGQDRSVGAEADTDRTGVSARGRTRTGQECRRGGGHGQDRSVGAEADTDRTDDNMTVSKHKLIREEKRERKQKRRGHAIIYRTRLGRQDYPTTTIQQRRTVRARLAFPITGNHSIHPSEIQWTLGLYRDIHLVTLSRTEAYNVNRGEGDLEVPVSYMSFDETMDDLSCSRTPWASIASRTSSHRPPFQRSTSGWRKTVSSFQFPRR